ncbi:unnamed protein product, partial [Candidula unifasciata]
DAHNCIPLFDEKTKTAFFAVYDGHGGHEVAKYCERYFPEFVKKLMNTEDPQDIASFIKKAFLQFDETLTHDDVIKMLKELAGKDDDNEDDDDCLPVGRSEAELLKEEADMPLDQLLAQYKLTTPDKTKNSHDSALQSPALRTESTDNNEAVLSQDAEDGPSSSVCTSSSGTTASPSSKQHKHDSSSQCSNGEDSVNKSSSSNQPETVVGTAANSSHTKCNNDSDNSITASPTVPSSVSKESSTATSTTEREAADGCESACVKQTGTCDSSQSSTLPEPAGSATGAASSQDADDGPSGSGASAKACRKSSKANTTENATTIDGYMDTSDDDEDDDDDDEDSWEDMSDSDDEDDDDEEDETEDVPMMNASEEEEPGSDSGCTACVVLMQENKLIVANAGDSRCVLSRAGKAVELSFDHKPEDDSEKERIENAGGKVTADGRVNGGLNLSRAIGDHVYKRNKDLPAEEQMITALPDVETADLCSDDQFIVIACDGIWNYMSSQEVVDYVLEKFKDPELRQKPSAVCEALFDHCLAPNTAGDGTGCDNMTCIIVVLDSFLKPATEQPTPDAAITQELVVKNGEDSLEKQPVNERGDAGSGSLKRCADNVEVREEKRVKVEEKVV